MAKPPTTTIGPEAAATELLRKVCGSGLDEAKRRFAFTSSLPLMFPSHHWKILEFSLGSETGVKVQAGGREKHGRIDTKHGALVVENKRDLSTPKARAEAEKQGREYVAGLVKAERNPKSVARLVLTDIERWYEYDVKFEGEPSTAIEANVSVMPRSQKHFSPTDGKAMLAYLEAVLWNEPIVATPAILQAGFGVGSELHRVLSQALVAAWSKQRARRESKLLFDLWFRHVVSSYGDNAEQQPEAFLAHGYLVMLSRIFAGCSLATPVQRKQAGFAEDCVRGDFFHSTFIRDFVERDFFRWLGTEETLEIVRPAVAMVAEQLQNLDFEEAARFDLLSELYEAIMPPGLRKEFGEVFTPGWLANRIVSAVAGVEKPGAAVLDPACGPGSFLRACVERKVSAFPPGTNSQVVLDQVLSDVAGFDINPVSISLAKATLAMALAEHISHAERPVRLPIYLADSLFTPSSVGQRKEKVTVLTFDHEDECSIEFPSRLFGVSSAFDSVVSEAHEQAELMVQGTGTPKLEGRVKKLVEAVSQKCALGKGEAEVLATAVVELREALAERVRRKRNGVWAFLLRNTYRPVLLRASFQFLITNPPWLTLSNLPEARYKEQLEKVAQGLCVKPKAESAHHQEIATVFALHAVEQFLVPGGQFAIVLPATILNGKHHEPLRASAFAEHSGLAGSRLWDFGQMDSLFKRPACVLFGSKKKTGGMPALLPAFRFSSEDAKPVPVEYRLTRKGTATYYGTTASAPTDTFYEARFSQGADIMPHTLYFVDLKSAPVKAVVRVETSLEERTNPINKKARSVHAAGAVEREYLFWTLKSDQVLPFLVGKPRSVALPLELKGGKYRVMDQTEIAVAGHENAKAWFETVQAKAKATKTTKIDRTLDDIRQSLRTRNKLVSQPSKWKDHLVFYGAGGKDVCAATAPTASFPLPFVNHQTLYVMQTDDETEAAYVVGMLNSNAVNEQIKESQPKGKHGEQHVHLRALMFPAYRPGDPAHQAVARASTAIAKAAQTLAHNEPHLMAAGGALAPRRVSFRKKLREAKPDLFAQLNASAKKVLSS